MPTFGPSHTPRGCPRMNEVILVKFVHYTLDRNAKIKELIILVIVHFYTNSYTL